MAASWIVFSVCVCAVLSQPIDRESVNNSVLETINLKNNLDKDTVLSAKVSLRDVLVRGELALPLIVNEIKRTTRTKRAIVLGHGCPGESIWFKGKCRPFEVYERMIHDAEE